MSTVPMTTVRAPAKDRSRANTLKRERHEPEYGILVATVALAAIGILMVYSSSAIKSYLSAKADPFAIVGPQIQWAALGLVAMLVMMRIDYRWLRVASVPMFIIGVVGLLLVFIPAIGVEVGGSARWIKIGPLPAVHPAEFMKLAMVVYLAHWFAKRGTSVHGLLSGTLPFLVIVGPVIMLVLLEPDLGTSSVLAFTAFTMFFLAGANLLHLVGMAAAAVPAVALVFLQGYQLARIASWLDPWKDKAGDGFHSVQGYYALALGGVVGAGLGESRLAGGLFLPNAFNDFIFAIIGEEFGLLGAGLVIVLFLAIGYLGIRTSLGAPDTFGAMLAAGITAWICLQAFINIAVVVGLIPVTGIPLPFVSAGGSSLIISFGAVGILLSVSRETVEKGTWNDAPADRGRGDGRSHLPGPRRRPIAPRSSRRA
ncbi:MAG TPA: putative lipid II flippase FtsW [Candidatus Limnocylindrales bacterium]|nr:putative lipid II flippase FtsW [Candidatus Limnocylindrales bacterium]